MMHQDNVSDLITFIIILTKQLLEISATDFKLQHNVSWSETVWLSDIWGEDVRWVITGFPSWRRGFKSFVKPNNLFSKPNQVTRPNTTVTWRIGRSDAVLIAQCDALKFIVFYHLQSWNERRPHNVFKLTPRCCVPFALDCSLDRRINPLRSSLM